MTGSGARFAGGTASGTSGGGAVGAVDWSGRCTSGGIVGEPASAGLAAGVAGGWPAPGASTGPGWGGTGCGGCGASGEETRGGVWGRGPRRRDGSCREGSRAASGGAAGRRIRPSAAWVPLSSAADGEGAGDVASDAGVGALTRSGARSLGGHHARVAATAAAATRAGAAIPSFRRPIGIRIPAYRSQRPCDPARETR